ncbi:MAG TPA: hypothetical protein ENJ11_07935 [Gammaproteobacteria bacterium]|nr:hypothetical protein [Gammaproteobacteria bacterium]
MLKQILFIMLLLTGAGLTACAADENAQKQTGATEESAPADNAGIDETLCPETRPQICTREYRPVCGRLAEGGSKTYSNGCEACADGEVVAFSADACAE